MKEQNYNSYKEYRLTIGNCNFSFFTDRGAISHSEDEGAYEHSHEFCELFFVSKGKLSIECDGNFYDLLENDGALISKGTKHKSLSNANHQRIVISFSIEKNKLKNTENYYDKYAEILKNPITIIKNFSECDCFRRFARYYYGNFKEKEQLILSCLHEIIILTKEYITQKDSGQNKFMPDSIMYRNYIISDYMEKNFRNASLTELAGILHLSTQQTHRILKKTYSASFSDIINRLKMQEARRLVENTTESFTKISSSLGYKCPHSFFNTFKKHYGLTPTEMRKNKSINNA